MQKRSATWTISGGQGTTGSFGICAAGAEGSMTTEGSAVAGAEARSGDSSAVGGGGSAGGAGTEPHPDASQTSAPIRAKSRIRRPIGQPRQSTCQPLARERSEIRASRDARLLVARHFSVVVG